MTRQRQEVQINNFLESIEEMRSNVVVPNQEQEFLKQKLLDVKILDNNEILLNHFNELLGILKEDQSVKGMYFGEENEVAGAALN